MHYHETRWPMYSRVLQRERRTDDMSSAWASIRAWLLGRRWSRHARGRAPSASIVCTPRIASGGWPRRPTFARRPHSVPTGCSLPPARPRLSATARKKLYTDVAAKASLRRRHNREGPPRMEFSLGLPFTLALSRQSGERGSALERQVGREVVGE